ncbi:hypothetical protein M1C57_02970 [Rhodococcus pyridinivorans]|uniref:hypothetical protein n=1 Tax=Rhodococcus pyridinivorans TaxID=103816 RepID=UPI00200A09FD|nr:hypothetical protein [Rhodococcus pyridinivorans]UPW05054.1 hypothetical protein M1C57_02970 [Rhodococcus pyridinivorans]
MTEPRRGRPSGEFSFGRHALMSVGAATVVLLVTAIVVVAVRPTPVVGLVIALVGIVAAVVAMGVVSTRSARRAFGPAEDDRPGS